MTVRRQLGIAAFAAVVLALAGSAVSPAEGPSKANGDGSKFYVAQFDGLPRAQMVFKVTGDEIARINFTVRMKCEGPNTRLSSGFLHTRLTDDGAFSRKRDLGAFRGSMKIAGTLDRRAGAGGLHAHLRGFEFDPHARSCRTGQTRWTAKRVSFRKFDAINRDIRNMPPRK